MKQKMQQDDVKSIKIFLDEKVFMLIKDINHRPLVMKAFIDRRIPEYKIYATIQTLLNDWRAGRQIKI